MIYLIIHFLLAIFGPLPEDNTIDVQADKQEIHQKCTDEPKTVKRAE